MTVVSPKFSFYFVFLRYFTLCFCGTLLCVFVINRFCPFSTPSSFHWRELITDYDYSSIFRWFIFVIVKHETFL